MKAWKISALMAMAVLFAITAFAESNKASIEINKNVVVGGKTLSPGRYTMTWEGQGQNVDLSVAQGKQVVVKTPARLLDLPKASPTNAIVTKDNSDGTHALSQIQFSGKKYALEIGDSTSQTDVASRAK